MRPCRRGVGSCWSRGRGSEWLDNDSNDTPNEKAILQFWREGR
jgi:hypothetical protein